MSGRLRCFGVVIAISLLTAAATALASIGALTPRGCIGDADSNPDHCPATVSGLNRAASVAVSPDGRSVYAVGQGDDAIVRFNRNTTTGALTAKGCIGDMDTNPDSCPTTAQGLNFPTGVAVSPDGKSVYVTSFDDNAVVLFGRNKATGALTPEGCVAETGSNPDGCADETQGLEGASSVAVSADGKSVYVAGESDNAIVRFHRVTTGSLIPKGCVADVDSNPDSCPTTAKGLNDVTSVAVSPDRKSVYATGFSDNAVVRFHRNTTTGALTPKGCIGDKDANIDGCAQTAKGLNGASSVAVSPDRKSVYATGAYDNAIVRFGRNKATGALTPQGCVGDSRPASENVDLCNRGAKGLQGARSVAVSGDGRSVYVAGTGDHAIVGFRRTDTGGLGPPVQCVADVDQNTDHCGQTARGLASPYSVAVSPDRGSVYAASWGDNAIVRFDRAR